ncbi:MAG TPA: HprK-related kinase A [Stellaceae bacterium]|nr:HprK-related kinase A [Stellaceae bacterium]
MTALALRFGPFAARLETSFAPLIAGLRLLYPPRAFAEESGFCDFRVAVAPGRGAHRWFRPQARFLLDGESPFKPLPADQALPMFEWGLNFAIAAQAHQYLVVHAAAIERGGRVAILPGAPGAGKSTLTAALVRRGWRLLSDELALIRPADRRVVPLARPVNLKNASIALMRGYAPDAVFSAETHDTAKGTVALMRAPDESMARSDEAAPVGWIVFPRWQPDAPPRLEPWSRAAGLMEIAHNAMNYSLHGAAGFALLADIFAASGCYRFTYGNLDDAVAAFAALASGAES